LDTGASERVTASSTEEWAAGDRCSCSTEPPEHLNGAVAESVTSDLLAATAGRTVVLISHQTHGFDAMDEIVHVPTREMTAI
jgi:ABC-type transport system involved in cytochrome bd biosynthesis fused ATPase/permease subunit